MISHHNVGNGSSGHTDRSVPIAVLGLGYWGPNLVRNVFDLPEADLVAVCDPSRDRLAPVGARYPTVRLMESSDDVFADSAIEAVVLATPAHTHYQLAEMALRAGKHVFVEKPLAGSVAECEDLIKLAHESALTLMPGHTFLYSPPVTRIRQMIEDKSIGDVLFVTTSRVNLGIHQSDISVISDLGPHDFAILQYWLDETPETVSAFGRACIVPGTSDVAFVNLGYASGTVAHVEISWLAPSKLRRTALIGTEKMVVYDDTSAEPVRVFDTGIDVPAPSTFGEYRLTYRTGDIVSPRIAATEPLSLELADFCGCIRSGDTPRSSAELGTDVVRIVAAAEQSILEGGRVVSLAATAEEAVAAG